MNNYKVLTLWEPWATLLVHGVKKIETRPSPTSWTVKKGTYLIHSAKRWTKEQLKICAQDEFYLAIDELNDNFIQSLGCIIGSVEVVECCLIRGGSDGEILLYPDPLSDYCLSQRELSFGYYRDGMYAWILQNPRLLKKPIPYKGGQGYYQNFKGDINQLTFIDDH